MPFPKSTPQDHDLKRLAMMLALHGVRNTVIEEYHSQGKLSDAEMKAFNIEVVNNLYSLLQLFTNPAYEEACKPPPRSFIPPTGGTNQCLIPRSRKPLKGLRAKHSVVVRSCAVLSQFGQAGG